MVVPFMNTGMPVKLNYLINNYYGISYGGNG